MKTSKQNFGFGQTLIALAVLAAFAPAHAQELTQPGSSVSVGIGAVSGDEKDRARFGMFNGLREHSAYGLFDFNYVKRDDAAGFWTRFTGRNLGLDTRELNFSQEKQGNWKYSLDYNEMVRYDPRTINTGMLGAGTTTPTVVRLATPGSGQDVNLDLKRQGITLAAEKWFSPSLQFQASFKNEDKDGARMFGKGFACSASWVAAGSCATSTTQWALLALPEPVNATTRQFEAKLNWNGGNFLLTGGYYGSFYTNSNGTLTPTIPGTLNNPLGAAQTVDAGLQTTLGLPMALPPNNQAHQFYVDGNYAFTPTTRATFRYAYTHATQDQDFGGAGLTGAPAGRSNYGGEINTTLIQAGVTARPLPKLNLLANVRYEDKDNKTPIALYNIEGTTTWTNGAPSPKKLTAKAEASYQLPAGYRGTLGADYEAVDHGAFTPTDQVAGLSGLRQKTEETGYRVEVRKSMSEFFTGALSYVSSRRQGDSPWLKPFSGTTTGVFEASPDCVSATVGGVPNACIYNRTGIFPIMFEDRERDKIRLWTNWTPTDRLSMQFWVEDGTDKYRGPTTKGLQDTGMRLYNVDAAYTLTDAWKLTGYWSHGDQMIHVAHSTGYMLALRDVNDAIGLGLIGKASERLQLGANLTYLNDKNVYGQTLDSAASAANVAFLAANGLPDVTYRVTMLKLFGQYALDKKSSIRVDLIHQRSRLNEWTWGYNGVPFAYSDNTTITSNPDQNVTFVGATYIYSWK